MSDATPLAPTHPDTLPPSASGWQRWRRWWHAQWRLLRRPRQEAAWSSLCSPHHARNQDAVLIAPPLYAVADGVGGGHAGELASSQLLDWCRGLTPDDWHDAATLADTLRAADPALAARLRALNTPGPSATTFAGVWLRPQGRGLVAHVGDSRVLRLRPQGTGPARTWQVEALTLDHTYAALGEPVPSGASPHDPARMVGVGAIGEPAVAELRLREGDYLLLCSDGLHRAFPDDSLAEWWALACQRLRLEMAQTDPADPAPHPALSSLQTLADRLSREALLRGSQDDISVLLVRFNPWLGARRHWWWALAGSVVLAVGSQMMG